MQQSLWALYWSGGYDGDGQRAFKRPAGKESFICTRMILLPGLQVRKRPENAAAMDPGCPFEHV